MHGWNIRSTQSTRQTRHVHTKTIDPLLAVMVSIDRVGQLHSMSKATELILMAYKLIYKNMTNSLIRANAIKQSEITMTDGSILIYNIDITLQTDREFSIAHRKIKDTIHGDIIDQTELSIVHLFSDCAEDDEADDILTADDYPESAE